MEQNGGLFAALRREDVMEDWRNICQEIAQVLSSSSSSSSSCSLSNSTGAPAAAAVAAAAVQCWLEVVLPVLCDEGAAAVSPAAVELVLPPLGRLVTTASTRLLTDLAEHDAAAAVAAVTSESHLKAFNLLELCLKAVLGTVGCVSGCLRPCVATVLTALLAVLQLCKEVEVQCGWAFEPFSRQLGGLFKQAFSLLKLAVECLDKVKVQEYGINTLTEDISQLLEVSRLSMNFDPSLTVLAWKALGKLLCRVKGHLHDDWSIQPIIKELCVTMETKASECVQCAPTLTNETPSPMFGKLLKLCRLLTTLLVKLVQEFEGNRHEYAGSLVQLLLSVHTTVPHSPPPDPPPPPMDGTRPPPSASGSLAAVRQGWLEEMDTHILVVREPLMAALLDCHVFVKQLLSPPGDASRDVGVVKGRGYAWTVCLCSLMKYFHKLPDGLQDYCMDSATSREGQSGQCRLVDAVFTSLRMCYVELQLPVRVAGVMCNGRPQSRVTLFEHVSTHLCAVAANIPARHFAVLEWALLRWLLSGEVHCSLLASDVWSHIASVCRDELRVSHVSLLAKMLEGTPESHTPSHVAMVTLLNRILCHLSTKHQERFVSAHPPGSHTKLWSFINPQVLTCTQVWSSLADECLRVLSTELQSSKPDGLAIYHGLRPLVLLYSSPTVVAALPSSTHHPALNAAWSIASSSPLLDGFSPPQLSVAVRCEALSLLAKLLHVMPPQNIVKVLCWLCELVTSSPLPPPLPVALAACSVLTHCGPLSLPPALKKGYQRGVSQLFHWLLISGGRGHWLLQHSALEAFKAFAELTPYAELVEPSIPTGERETVVCFLNQQQPPGTTTTAALSFAGLTAVLECRGEWRRGEGGEAAAANCNQQHSQELDDCLAQMQSLWTQVANSNRLHPSATQLSQLQDMCHSIQQFISAHS